MGEETEFRFDDHNAKKKSAMAEFGKFLWNSDTKEFCGRDGASWGKVSLFYAVFYLCLGSFFVGMLAVFFQIMPKDRPTYFGEAGTIASRKLNPGLGFRPQVDVEDNLISFNPAIANDEKKGYNKYVNNLENFLNAKYSNSIDEANVIDCVNGKENANDLRSGKSCKFDYKTIFANTPCTREQTYGYNTNKPCVLVKLNKMIDYIPVLNENATAIEIKCYHDTAADKEHVKGVTYYSEGEGGVSMESKEFGTIDIKYFPFYSQKEYRAPFVWVQFDVTPDTLVNLECRGYAKNIEHERMTRRGLTKIVVKVLTS
jgi:sodium/potassium-transporting ATPase subunit beta